MYFVICALTCYIKVCEVSNETIPDNHRAVYLAYLISLASLPNDELLSVANQRLGEAISLTGQDEEPIRGDFKTRLKNQPRTTRLIVVSNLLS